MQKFQAKNAAEKTIKSVLSALAGMLATITVCIVAALLISSQKIEEDTVDYIAWIALSAGAICASLLSRILWKEYAVWASVSGGGVYWLLLLLTGCLIGDALHGVWVTAILILGCAIAVGLVGTGRKSQKSSLYKVRQFKRFV